MREPRLATRPILFLLLAIFFSLSWIPQRALAAKPNLLIITVDDMSCDSVGAYGCKLAETTPNMDALARSALRFEYAHVVVGNCMPSRNVMWSGLYPHNNGVEGFYQVPTARHPHICDIAQNAGYFTAIRHKISHSTPYSPYKWDMELDVSSDGKKVHVKDAESYGESTRRAIDAAEQAGKPLCALINISDPHKPFYSQVKQGKDPHVPTRIFHADEVPVPGFLPSDAEIKGEVALYYSSVRRADDGVGAILKALDESGQRDNTVVLFLSDHGMPLPFAKTQLYHHSTRTPLMVRWPNVTTGGSVDSTHMVSAVDFIPTLCEILDWKVPENLDGRSFAAAIRGEKQANRDFVFKEYNENSGAKRNPMRAVESKDYLYIFNPWSDGKLVMGTATNGTQSWKRMKAMAALDTRVAARVDVMEHRSVEELYHVASDPDCLVNLIDDPEHAQAADQARDRLLKHLRETRDPVVGVFENRTDKAALTEYMKQSQDEADARRNRKRARQTKPGNSSASVDARTGRRNGKLITWEIKSIDDKHAVVVVRHKLPAQLKTKDIFVTLKSAENKRIQRIHAQVSGEGSAEFKFQLPAEGDVSKLRLAAFVGEDFQHNLQFLSGTIGGLQQ